MWLLIIIILVIILVKVSHKSSGPMIYELEMADDLKTYGSRSMYPPVVRPSVLPPQTKRYHIYPTADSFGTFISSKELPQRPSYSFSVYATPQMNTVPYSLCMSLSDNTKTILSNEGCPKGFIILDTFWVSNDPRPAINGEKWLCQVLSARGVNQFLSGAPCLNAGIQVKVLS